MWIRLRQNSNKSQLALFGIGSHRWTNSATQRILAIRREDASVWERRAPLAPSHVKHLVKNGVKVLVQPSNRRAYPMQGYVNAGATIQEDISESNLIMGVKQVPIDSLLRDKTYCFFSHTIKAQEANMPLLDAVLKKNIRLIDYEKMTDNKSLRLVAFGKYAGVAGMINILHGLGLRLLALGHHTPFMHIGPAHNYRNSGMARQAIRDAGYEISLGMMPKSIGPLTFVFTGSGNVSQGAQEVFQELPYEYVDPKDLPIVAEQGSVTKVYGAVVSRDDHFRRKDGGGFDANEYENHPELYYSAFAKEIAPYASVIINGIYWAVNSPKLLTIPDAKHLLQPSYAPWLPSALGSPSLPHRLLAICDISADPGGSIEFMSECTTIDVPFCLYDADQHQNSESFAGPGVLVCSIDNMPTQLPIESTDFFGNLLFPYVPDFLNSDATKPLSAHKFHAVVDNAIITSNGELTPNFEYIAELRKTSKSKKKVASTTESNRRILVLGAGYVSAPLIQYLSRDPTVHLVVGTSLQNEGEALAQIGGSNCENVILDVVKGSESLSQLIKESNLVISLLPYALHPVVAEECIRNKVNMVTASYLSPEMSKMHQAAVDANITILNEVGLDPGVDHLLAMECFNEVKMNGGRVESFVSYCGGLPAPENSDNALRYKFSWSPKGVLLNTLSSAKYLLNNEVIEVPSGGELMSHLMDIDFLPGFNLEGYPNRNSLIYKDVYGIPNAHTVLRGSLRYKGYAEAIKGLHLLGLMSTEEHPCLHTRGPEITWQQFLCNLVGQQDNILISNLKNLVYDQVGRSEFRTNVIESLGLMNDTPLVKMSTPVDTLAHLLNKKLSFSNNERDLVILRHNIGIKWSENEKEMRQIDLVSYGDKNGFSAMGKLVGYPAAIASKMVLDGEIQTKGMVVPMSKDIYQPMLTRLKQEGISSVEKSVKL